MFDAEAFFHALHRERVRRGLSWNAVAKEAGIGPMVLYRIEQFGSPSLETALRLSAWLGKPGDLRPYIKSPEPQRPSEH